MNKSKIKIGIIITGILALAGTLFATHAFAADVDIRGLVSDADCFWSGGPGTELYVPNGKTCILTGTLSAENRANFTDYGVIVYPGGTLIIGDTTTDTTFSVDGDVLNMGTIYIGDTTGSAYSSALNIVNSGKLLVGYNATANLTVRNNSGAGNNNIFVDGDTHIGTSGLPSNPTFSYDSTSTSSTLSYVEVYGEMNVNAGTLAIDGVHVADAASLSGDAQLNVANGARLNIMGYFPFSGRNVSLGIGMNGNEGYSTVTIDGQIYIAPAATADVWVIVGLQGGPSQGKLVINPDTGVLDIKETNTFLNPATLESPTNALWILTSSPYGLHVGGDLLSDMAIRNNGYITVDKLAGTAMASIEGRNSYIQASSLNIASGELVDITGMALIDGDVQVDGTLTVSDCTMAINDAGESFQVGSTGNFTTGDGTCTLVGPVSTSADDGLNIQGTNTLFQILDGADVLIDGAVTIDDEATLDAQGYFVTNDDLRLKNGAYGTLEDTDVGDDFEADNLSIEPPSPTSTGIDTTLNIATSSTLSLKVGNVAVGTFNPPLTDSAILNIKGVLNTPSGSIASFTTGPTGIVTIDGSGTVNIDTEDDAAGIFLVAGGFLNVYGTLNISKQEFRLNNQSGVTAYVYVFDTGLVDSTATPASPRVGFDFNGGNLTIVNGTSGTTNGAMKFADEIIISTPDSMAISGYLEGTESIVHNATGATSIIYPAGEMKVVDDTGNPQTPQITIYDDLQLYGKLNADGGNGAVVVSASNAPVIGGPGYPLIDSYAYILTGDLILEPGTAIDVSEFVESYDPGGSETYGGSYGGRGGGAGTSPFGETKYFTKPNYDTAVKNPVGMFGFTSAGASVSNGGGGIYIEAKKNLILDGDIRANGADVAGTNRGAGSGGLIVIDHNILHTDTGYEFSGSGTIEANGGAGTLENTFGGGGGRIIIKSILFEDPDDDETLPPHYEFAGTVRARGGIINNGSTYAGAGTIVYLGDDNSPNDSLIVDQEDRTIGASVVTNVRNDLFSTDIFDRIEARNGATLEFINALATAPTSCFESGTGSSVDLLSAPCTPNPDKPDTLHVNNSYAGAQTSHEPYAAAPAAINDLTPEFSVKARNPEDTTSVSKLRVQVTQDPDKFNNPANYRTCVSGCLWDADVTLDTATAIDGRSIDFEYAGPALTPNSTYYIRVAFYDSTGTNLGLWTHRDMDNHYKFTISPSYYEITNDCSDLIQIRDVLAAGRAVGSALKYSDGDRYGYGSCGFTINTTEPTWKVLYGMSPNGTALTDSNGNHTISPIDNGLGDCSIDTSGNKGIGAEEEYGYNIADVSGTSSYVKQDAECLRDYDDWTPATGSYVFDIEANASEDKILEDLTSSITGGQFDLYTYATIDAGTPSETYNLETWMVMTSAP